MSQRRTAKLARLPLPLIYEGRSNLVHALEALSEQLDFQQIAGLRAAHGGYGYSPSSTAAVLLRGPMWDEAAASWLRDLPPRTPGAVPGAMPASHPADTFEAAWVVHVLWHGGVPLRPATNAPLRALLRWLAGSLTPAGASFARQRAMPCDADDTAMVLVVLNRLGVRMSLDSLMTFEAADHFVSYVGERTASTSANAHVLEALCAADAAMRPALAAARAKVLRYLRDSRCAEGYWLDKWHLSPHYATMSCVLALASLEPAERPDGSEIAATLEWLRESQRRAGGWGGQRSTAEETAYALLTLATCVRAWPGAACARDRESIWRGRAYLLRSLSMPIQSAPPLWVDKTLYAPPRVIRAAVLAALHAVDLATATLSAL